MAAERSDGGATAVLQEKIAEAQRRVAAAEKSYTRLRTICMGAEQVGGVSIRLAASGVA